MWNVHLVWSASEHCYYAHVQDLMDFFFQQLKSYLSHAKMYGMILADIILLYHRLWQRQKDGVVQCSLMHGGRPNVS